LINDAALVYNKKKEGKMTRSTAKICVITLGFLVMSSCYESSNISNDVAQSDDSGSPDTAEELGPDIPTEVPPDVFTDVPTCDISCPSGWMPACMGTSSWCVSPFQGDGDCCMAWERCSSLGAFPGFWPTAGPYEGIMPADFFEHVHLPGIVISFSGYDFPPVGEPYVIASIACFDERGIKDKGETHTIPADGHCEAESCLPYHHSIVCEGDYIGCGCILPFWCVFYE